MSLEHLGWNKRRGNRNRVLTPCNQVNDSSNWWKNSAKSSFKYIEIQPRSQNRNAHFAKSVKLQICMKNEQTVRSNTHNGERQSVGIWEDRYRWETDCVVWKKIGDLICLLKEDWRVATARPFFFFSFLNWSYVCKR